MSLNLRLTYDYFTNNDWRGNCEEKKYKNKKMNTFKMNQSFKSFVLKKENNGAAIAKKQMSALTCNTFAL